MGKLFNKRNICLLSLVTLLLTGCYRNNNLSGGGQGGGQGGGGDIEPPGRYSTIDIYATNDFHGSVEETDDYMGLKKWATYLKDADLDFEYINNLPGKKLLLKGNHDYWWTTLNKLRTFVEEEKFSNIDLEDLNESKAIGRQSFGKAGCRRNKNSWRSYYSRHSAGKNTAGCC